MGLFVYSSDRETEAPFPICTGEPCCLQLLTCHLCREAFRIPWRHTWAQPPAYSMALGGPPLGQAITSPDLRVCIKSALPSCQSRNDPSFPSPNIWATTTWQVLLEDFASFNYIWKAIVLSSPLSSFVYFSYFSFVTRFTSGMWHMGWRGTQKCRRDQGEVRGEAGGWKKLRAYDPRKGEETKRNITG